MNIATPENGMPVRHPGLFLQEMSMPQASYDLKKDKYQKLRV